jgi:phenylalanine-4-hydroxylase
MAESRELPREVRDRRVSLLIELDDRPGALADVLGYFSRHGVNLTHIESRPARDRRFDFFVDCEGARGERPVEAVIAALEQHACKLLVLDERRVPWFPRHVSELDRIANHTLDAGADLESDHPGFNDKQYRERRAMIDRLARNYRHGDEIPKVDYTREEIATWREILQHLMPLQRKYACSEYLRAYDVMARECGYRENNIPQARDVNAFLQSRTGFRLRPVAGLLSPRDFLNGLAFRVFFSTQYIRHHSKPLYTPEPDVCHELIGHAPMFAEPAFAELSQEIGLASLGASDDDIERLSRCYWFSVEFGLVREQDALKAYGAGLLSSYGELEYACSKKEAELLPWDPEDAAHREYPITEYQPLYYVAESLPEARKRMSDYCRTLARPFYARFHAATDAIWVDRAVSRNAAD